MARLDSLLLRVLSEIPIAKVCDDWLKISTINNMENKNKASSLHRLKHYGQEILERYEATGRNPVVLSWGRGVDSTALLVELILNPAARDFELEDLIVVTAVVGREWERTDRDCEEVILPLLRHYNILLIQAGRKSNSQTDGVEIFSCTRQPKKIYRRGIYNLDEHLLIEGIVPQRANNKRLCTLHFKGFVVDWVIKQMLGSNEGQFYRYVLGFNADEIDRRKDDSVAWRKQVFEFLLIDWKWTRQHCENYINNFSNRIWRKSSCSFCPFSAPSGGLPLLIASWLEQPEEGALAAMIEANALAMNPEQPLYGKNKLVLDLLIRSSNIEAIDRLSQMHTEKVDDWAIYSVRRLFYATAEGKKRAPQPNRQTKIVAQGHRNLMISQLGDLACRYGRSHELVMGSWRFWSLPRGENKPYGEEMFVACPRFVREKQGIKDFDGRWTEITGRMPAFRTNIGDKSDEFIPIKSSRVRHVKH